MYFVLLFSHPLLISILLLSIYKTSVCLFPIDKVSLHKSEVRAAYPSLTNLFTKVGMERYNDFRNSWLWFGQKAENINMNCDTSKMAIHVRHASYCKTQTDNTTAATTWVCLLGLSQWVSVHHFNIWQVPESDWHLLQQLVSVGFKFYNLLHKIFIIWHTFDCELLPFSNKNIRQWPDGKIYLVRHWLPENQLWLKILL